VPGETEDKHRNLERNAERNPQSNSHVGIVYQIYGSSEQVATIHVNTEERHTIFVTEASFPLFCMYARHGKDEFPNADKVTLVDDAAFLEQATRQGESIQSIVATSEVL